MEKAPVVLIVGTNVVPEREDELNEWYNNVHLPMMAKAPGMLRAARYRLESDEGELPRYLAIYEMESEEAIKLFKESPEREAARRDRFERWGETDFTVAWRGYGRLLGTWEK